MRYMAVDTWLELGLGLDLQIKLIMHHHCYRHPIPACIFMRIPFPRNFPRNAAVKAGPRTVSAASMVRGYRMVSNPGILRTKRRIHGGPPQDIEDDVGVDFGRDFFPSRSERARDSLTGHT